MLRGFRVRQSVCPSVGGPGPGAHKRKFSRSPPNLGGGLRLTPEVSWQGQFCQGPQGRGAMGPHFKIRPISTKFGGWIQVDPRNAPIGSILSGMRSYGVHFVRGPTRGGRSRGPYVKIWLISTKFRGWIGVDLRSVLTGSLLSGAPRAGGRGPSH